MIMNKIINGVANDYEFPNLYDPNISYSKAYMEQLLAEKDKEIERLNKEKDDLDDCNRHLHNENKRLNNIINELEKWLQEKQDLTCGCGITPEYIYAYENCLDKLKELKEEKNE